MTNYIYRAKIKFIGDPYPIFTKFTETEFQNFKDDDIFWDMKRTYKDSTEERYLMVRVSEIEWMDFEEIN